MTYSVVWITLPNGFASDGRARLSLVAAPRVINRGDGTLQGSPLANWPAVVRALLSPMSLRLAVAGTPGLAPVELDGGAASLPDSDLWRDLFPPTTVVDVRGRGTDVLGAVKAAESFVDAAEQIDAIYAGGGAAGGATARERATAVEQRLEALAALYTDPAGTRRRVAGPGAFAAAVDAVTPIAAFAAGLRAPSGTTSRSTPNGPTARIGTPLAPVRTVDQADFHQVIGLLMGHPRLSRALGLRVDLLTPAFTGQRSIRVVTADGAPLNGPIPRPQSFSRVTADPGTGRFVMATQPGGVGVHTEVIEGTLDAAPTPGSNGRAAGRYVVTTTDVAALSRQLLGVAQARAHARQRAAEADPGALPQLPPVRLPVRRDVGLTVAQAGRPASTVAFAEDRAFAIENPTTELVRADRAVPAVVPTEDGAAVLFADDVTSGYRVDVAVNGGPFRSLMRRKVAYRVKNRNLTADDEGKVEAITAVQQTTGNGDVQLRTGEQLFTWNGWGLAVPKPGRKALGVLGPNGETTAPAPSEPAKGYDLHIAISAAPNTIPRLRFGREYQFQVRTVDLAGNAIEPQLANPARALPRVRYRRKEAAPPPVAVPRTRFTPGESLNHWVVRTDGSGVPVGPTGQPAPAGGAAGSQRHLVPAKAPQAMAESHGEFDAAFGPDATPAARAAALKVAERESGTLLDPTAPGPTGDPVPAPGIAYVSNDPDAEPVPRPPRGEALPNGYYVVHDTPAIRTPYLADPVAAGAALVGLAGQQAPVVVPFTGAGWPDVQPARVVVLPGTAPLPKPTLKAEAGRPTLHLEIPPGATITAELATALRADKLGQLDTRSDPAVLTSGADLGMSARQPVTIVHATLKPVAAPVFGSGPTVTPQGAGSSVSVTSTVQCHAASTGQVDVVARWQERLDTGEGDLLDEPRSTGAGSRAVADASSVNVTGVAHFGDLRHRTVTFTPEATSAFREYFSVRADRDPSLVRSGAPVTRSIPNRLLPPLPRVHSIVPTFTRSNSLVAGVYTANTIVRGVRVYLERTWLQTGEDERLGVVVHTTAAEAEAARTGNRRVQDFVSQWGADPLQEKDDLEWEPLVPEDFAEGTPRQVIELIDPGATEKPQSNGQPNPFRPVVSVMSFPVVFDAERNLWFADVDLRVNAVWPFVRLAVVRFQPDSVGGKTHSQVVVTDFVQLPPDRQLVAQRAAGVGVKVEILGPETAHSRFRLRQERRIGAPLITAHDLGSSVGVGPTSAPDPDSPETFPPCPPAPPPPPPPNLPLFTDLDGWRLTDQRPGNGALGRLRLERSPGAQALDPTIKAELLAGRVVVEEIQTGMDVRGPGRTTRVVWTDVFDRTILGMA